MPIVNTMRRQQAVYWPPGTAGADGQAAYSPCVQLRVRWEGYTTQLINREGRVVLSQARVYPGEDLEVGGMLFLGTIDDLVSQADPTANPGTYEIIKFDKIPSLRNQPSKTLRIAYL